MKKTVFVILAGLLAITFSAFTPKKATTYYYQTSSGSFAQFTGSPCPEGSQIVCVRNQPGVGQVVVLRSEDENDELWYNP